MVLFSCHTDLLNHGFFTSEIQCFASYKAEIKVSGGLYSLPKAVGKNLLPKSFTLSTKFNFCCCRMCVPVSLLAVSWRLVFFALRASNIPSCAFHGVPSTNNRSRPSQLSNLSDFFCTSLRLQLWEALCF